MHAPMQCACTQPMQYMRPMHAAVCKYEMGLLGSPRVRNRVHSEKIMFLTLLIDAFLIKSWIRISLCNVSGFLRKLSASNLSSSSPGKAKNAEFLFEILYAKCNAKGHSNQLNLSIK